MILCRRILMDPIRDPPRSGQRFQGSHLEARIKRRAGMDEEQAYSVVDQVGFARRPSAYPRTKSNGDY